MKSSTVVVTERLILILSLIVVVACGTSSEKARRELGAMNVEYSPEAFLKSISNGDITAVRLFLEAGMNPNTEGRFELIELHESQFTGPGLVLATWKGQTRIVEMLLTGGADPNGLAGGISIVDALTAAQYTPHLNEEDRVAVIKILVKNGARLHREIPELKKSKAKQMGEAYQVLLQIQKDFGILPIPWDQLGEKGRMAKENEERNQAASNEASAIASVRNLMTAEIYYFAEKCGNGKYGSLADLRRCKLIDEALASGTKDGYRFTIDGAGSAADLQIIAIPINSGRREQRSFLGDSTGVIRYSIGSQPSRYSTPLGH